MRRFLTTILLGAFVPVAACARVPRRPNVLLITVDTLRADRISALGSAKATTPNLDRLAAEGLLFTHAESPRAKTTPAIASLMTGLYPHEHGVRDLLMPVARERPILPQRFREAGYRTAAIVGNFVLKDEYSGLKRGFDQWTEELPQTFGVPPDDVPQRTARSLTDGALVALGLARECDAGPREPCVREGQPWFLWLHYMDPHGLYDPPPEHRVFAHDTPDPIPDDPGPGPGELQRHYVAEYNVPDSARMPPAEGEVSSEGQLHGRIDAASVRDLYDGEVHYADAEIGRLLDALSAAGMLEDTLVVVTSDHGESLGEHRYWFEHGRDAYEVTCRVPLIVRLPDRFERRPLPGRRTGDLSLADLGPTLLDLVRLPPLAPPAPETSVRGTSRANLVLAEDTRLHPVFAERVDRADRSGAIQHKAVRIGDWKLIRRYTHRFDERKGNAKEVVVLSEELYNLARDPYETQNRIAEPPESAALVRLQAELLRFSSADVHFSDLALSLQKQREELERNDRETLRIIEALGY